MRNDKGQFTKGHHFSPETEFKKGQHWRPKKPYWDKDWLVSEYATKERSANDIASEFGITEAAILFWLRKHNILRREMSNIRSKKHWGLAGEQNGMYGRTGENSSNWKGGITPERQEFYISDEWKKACSEVYKRDNAQCQRCGNKDNLHVHHIVTFANKELRADIDNLVLLCAKCHRFVHSKKNNNREYTREEVRGC
jgi:hypothetical protein